jgi:hypothetical protein
MKAILKSIRSPDVFDLSGYTPIEDENFSILLQLIVAPLNSKGEESFDILLCTPQWLIANHKKSDIIIGRHYLIVFEYNYQRIYNTLKELIENIEADTWDEIGMKIGRVGKWEFEDYSV